MRRWLWLRFTPLGRYERRLGLEWARGPGSRRVSAETTERLRACNPHPNREMNPKATALDPTKYRAERCLDCGTGIVTRLTP